MIWLDKLYVYISKRYLTNNMPYIKNSMCKKCRRSRLTNVRHGKTKEDRTFAYHVCVSGEPKKNQIYEIQREV